MDVAVMGLPLHAFSKSNMYLHSSIDLDGCACHTNGRFIVTPSCIDLINTRKLLH